MIRRELLETLRKRLMDELDSCEGRDLAPLSRELRAIAVELDALPVPQSTAPADEIARRREDRRKKAAGE